MRALLFILLITLLEARPKRPEQREGEVRNFKNQKHFTYDNSKLKSSSKYSQSPILKYDIEMADNYHSLDDDEKIENVICNKESVELVTTSKLNDWKNGDVFTGSDMWNCPFGLMRKIVSIEYEGFENGEHFYFVKTVDAQLNEMFKKADVDYHLQTPEEYMKNEEEASTLKKGTYSLDVISPTEGTVVDSEVGLEVSFSIVGCNAVDCGDVTVKAMIYANDHVWPIADTLRTSFVATCSAETDYNCRYLIPMKNDGYGYDEKDYVKFEFYKNDKKFLEKEMEFITNDVKFIFELPLKGTVMSMDDPLDVTWDVTSATLRKWENVEFKFYKQVDWWFDSVIHTVSVPTKDLKMTYQLTEAKGFEKGATYYMIVDLQNGEEYRSSYFTITDGSDSISLITPDCTTFISKGDKLTVGWEYKNELSSDKIKVKMIRAISWWPDETVYNNENVDIKETQLTIDVGSMTPSTKYFIKIEYQAEGKTHYAYSDYFTYATAKIFTVTSSNTDEKNRRISINMKVNQYIGKYYVSVHQKFPVFSMLDYEIEGTQQQEITEYSVGQVYSQSFAYTQGTPFRAYVEFKYRCLYKDHLCDEEKYYIDDVPYEETLFSWNYDSLTHSIANPSIDVIQYDCQNGVNTENVGTSFSDICGRIPHFDFEFSTTCEDCYVFAPIKAFGFELLINAGYAYKAKLNLETDLEMSMGVLATFRGEYHFNYDTPLTDNLNFKIRIALGPVLVTIQPSMQFFFGFNFDTVIMLEAQAQETKAYSLLLSFDSTKEKLKDQFTVVAKDLSPENALTASVNGNVDISIDPTITATFGLDCKCYGVTFISGDINFKLGVDMDIHAQYPAYPVDNVYSSDYPYYIKVDANIFLLMNYKVTLFDNVLTEQNDIDLLEDNLKYKFAFAKVKTSTEGISMSLPIKASYGKLSELEQAALQFEIGKLANELGNNKYAVRDINKYLISGEMDQSRGTDDVMYYNFHALDTKANYDVMFEVKQCIVDGSCSASVTKEDYPTIEKIKPHVLPCQLSQCYVCSLDETACE